MDDRRFERVESKLDSINGHMSSIDITLAKQSVLLAEHIRRTNLLEKKLEPIEKHVMITNLILKIIGALAAAGGAGHGILHSLLKIY